MTAAGGGARGARSRRGPPDPPARGGKPAAAGPAAAPEPGAPPDPAPPERVARILLVDDVLPLLDLQQHYLKRTTCHVVLARSAREAIDACRREAPDLVFLDAGLPDMDGIEACRRIKEVHPRPPVAVIMAATPDRRAACLAGGCDEVVLKPIAQAAFLDAVRRHVPLLERQEDRIPASLRVTFTTGAKSYAAYTRDLSPHGVFLKTRRPFAPGTRLELGLHLKPGVVLALRGEVRRMVERGGGGHLLPGIGVRFVEPDPQAIAAVVEFIAARMRPREP